MHTIAFSTLITEKYAPWANAHLKLGQQAIQRIKVCFFPVLGNKQLKEITPFAVEHWSSKRLKSGRKASTVNRDIVVLKAALAKAVEWGVVDVHPLQHLKLLKVDAQAKVRYLDAEEEKRLRQTLNERENALRVARQRGNLWRAQRDYRTFGY